VLLVLLVLLALLALFPLPPLLQLAIGRGANAAQNGHQQQQQHNLAHHAGYVLRFSVHKISASTCHGFFQYQHHKAKSVPSLTCPPSCLSSLTKLNIRVYLTLLQPITQTESTAQVLHLARIQEQSAKTIPILQWARLKQPTFECFQTMLVHLSD